MKKEEQYIRKRLLKGKVQSIPFYLCRIFPIHRRKIVFCCIEGTTGYTCNPKYIAEELIRRKENAKESIRQNENKEELIRQKKNMEESIWQNENVEELIDEKENFELVWLVNDTSKQFPQEIKVVKNTLWNRAYELTTAHIWIDNSRKQLEARKRKGQVYIQTWHAKLGFKPTCLDRGASFSRIAYMVSKHDSDMIDYVLSNSKWYDDTLPTGMLYNGPTLRFGSPRCDILINQAEEQHKAVRKQYGLPGDAKLLMYAPTFRGGSQSVNRMIQTEEGTIDYDRLVRSLEQRFGGTWYILLRLHPQLVARHIESGIKNDRLIDVSSVDDMYELLAGCNAFMTDYSSAAFDAAVMKIPIFLYCDDYKDYEKERGKLLWDLRELPFGLAQNNDELEQVIRDYREDVYKEGLRELLDSAQVLEDGRAAERVAEFLREVNDEQISIRIGRIS